MRNLKKPDPDSGQPSDIRTVTVRALDLLSRREHSAKELRYKLEARGFEPQHIEAALAQLSGKGLLNEQRFVESYVHGRIRRGYGPVRIRAELRDRGAETEMDDWSPDEDIDWTELAITAREKRFGKAAPKDYKERAKQMRFLQQRGFTSEQINAVFKSA